MYIYNLLKVTNKISPNVHKYIIDMYKHYTLLGKNMAAKWQGPVIIKMDPLNPNTSGFLWSIFCKINTLTSNCIEP